MGVGGFYGWLQGAPSAPSLSLLAGYRLLHFSLAAGLPSFQFGYLNTDPCLWMIEYKKPNCVGVPYSTCSLCQQSNISTVNPSTCTSFNTEQCFCSREGGVLYLLLSFGTVLLGVTLYNCRKRLDTLPDIFYTSRFLSWEWLLALLIANWSFLMSREMVWMT